MGSRLLANWSAVGPATSEQAHILEIAGRKALHLGKLRTQIVRKLCNGPAPPGLAFSALEERLTDPLIDEDGLGIHPALCSVPSIGEATFEIFECCSVVARLECGHDHTIANAQNSHFSGRHRNCHKSTTRLERVTGRCRPARGGGSRFRYRVLILGGWAIPRPPSRLSRESGRSRLGPAQRRKPTFASPRARERWKRSIRKVYGRAQTAHHRALSIQSVHARPWPADSSHRSRQSPQRTQRGKQRRS